MCNRCKIVGVSSLPCTVHVAPVQFRARDDHLVLATLNSQPHIAPRYIKSLSVPRVAGASYDLLLLWLWLIDGALHFYVTVGCTFFHFSTLMWRKFALGGSVGMREQNHALKFIQKLCKLHHFLIWFWRVIAAVHAYACWEMGPMSCVSEFA